MLKIWGRASSANVMKVLWCCDELGERYERVDWAGEFGGNDDPKYRAMNPNGRVPTVEDAGNTIWESNTIVRYLCATRKGGERLYPTAPGPRTQVERWMDWQLAHGGSAMTPIFFGYVRTPPEKRDPAALEKARVAALQQWQIVESDLSNGRPYLAGKDFTLADIPAAIFARRWFGLPIERPPLPRLEAWYERVKTRPGFVAHVGVPMK